MVVTVGTATRLLLRLVGIAVLAFAVWTLAWVLVLGLLWAGAATIAALLTGTLMAR